MKRIVMLMVCGVFAAAGLTVRAEEPQKAAESGVTSVSPGTGANDPYIPPIDVDGDLLGSSNFETELSHPSRSYVDTYSEKDPAFSKFVDVSLLSSAMASPDASQLIDVALGLSEGERVLVRTHESGLTADNLMAKAVKLAISSGDTASQERISKAATAHGRDQWAKLLADAKEFGGASRDGATVSINKIDAPTATLIQDVRQACNVAMLTGQKTELEAAKKDVAASKADESIKTHLNELIEGNLKSIPDVADDTQILLAEFSAGSRGWNPGKTWSKIEHGDIHGAMGGVDIRIPENSTQFSDGRDYSYWITIGLRNRTDYNVAVRYSGGVGRSFFKPGYGFTDDLRVKSEGTTARTPWLQIQQLNGEWGTKWNLKNGGRYKIIVMPERSESIVLSFE